MDSKSISIDAWLRDVSNEFADAMIPSARLDAEIILAHTIGRPRTWLHAHGDEPLDPRRKDIADARAQLRLERVPVAYIIGHKYFYGRRFVVTPATLIPRPESEALIGLLKDFVTEHPNAKRLVDIGTGSGCLGITAKLELPQLDVTLLDTSKRALTIAEKNAGLLAADVRLLRSDLLDGYPLAPDIILANLPYVDRGWNTPPELKNEPDEALYADENGLKLIYECTAQAAEKLGARGALILEADERQHAAIIEYATKKHGFRHLATDGLGLLFAA